MPQGPLPACTCIGSYNPTTVLQWLYCALLTANATLESINEAVGGGEAGAGEFTSSPALVTASGSIPAGVLGWSFTSVSGTVTLNGSGTLPLGATFRGGGYGGKTMSAAIPYTITAGSALVSYDTPT